MTRSYSPVRGKAPEPADFGIVNPRTLVEGPLPGRWESGMAVDSLSCDTAVRIVDICNTTLAATSQEPAADRSSQEYLPFEVQAEYVCSTFGFEEQEYRDRARLALEVAQNKAIEREFWRGDLAQAVTADDPADPSPNQYLTNGNAEQVGSGAVKPKVGLALLEQAIADCGVGAKGVIHAPRGVASIMTGELNPKEDQGVLETVLGNLVIAGSGYDGTGPNGEAQTGTQYWVYATGPVSVHLGEPLITPDTMAQAVDTRNNNVSFVAARFAGATWDGCCHYAVLVDLAA